MPETSTGLRNADLLTVYLNDHLAASVGGIELVGRMIGVHRGSAYEAPLEQLRRELYEENEELERVISALGLPVQHIKKVLLWAAEKVSRVKPNGRWVTRSPLSDLVEFEFLASAVRAKRSGFESLREVAAVDDRIDARVVDGLIEQANRQHAWVTEVRREVAARIFGGDPDAPDAAADR
ncbi:hypothetical protein ACI8AC_09310 [Geodermatophilus sp. SYSU D00758]